MSLEPEPKQKHGLMGSDTESNSAPKTIMAMNIYRNEQLKEPKMKGYIYENCL